VNITSPDVYTFNGTLTLAGVTVVSIVNVSLARIDFDAGSQEPFLEIYGNGLSILGPDETSILGNLVAIGAGIILAGPVTSRGAVIVSNSTLSVFDSLTLEQSSALQLTYAQLVVYGFIRTEELIIPLNSTLTSQSTVAAVYGNLVNGGVLSVPTTNSNLFIEGNLTLQHSGLLSVGIATGSYSPLGVNGSVELAGNIQYTLAKKPVLSSSEKYLVLTATGYVNGTFAASASPTTDSSISRNLGLQYNDKTVYIIYNFHPADVDVWMWAVLGVVVALVIIIVVGIIVKCRRNRAQYQRVY